jgi:hypothetical protein
MQSLTGQLAGLDESASVLLIMVGLIYGLFGWRLVRFLVIIDALAVAILCAALLAKRESVPYTTVPAMPVALGLLLLIPLLAWKFPSKANIGMAGLAGFVSMQLFLLNSQLPGLVMLVVGFVGAGFAMALAMTLARQTTVVITGLHGGWLCVAALSIVAFNNSNLVGHMLNSFYSSFSLVMPLAAVAFSTIMIFLQWSDMQNNAAQED